MRYCYLFFIFLGLLGRSALAQVADPAYQANVMRFSAVTSLAVQPNGNLLALGNQLYTNGVLSGSLVRFKPGGAFDAQFTQQTVLVAVSEQTGLSPTDPYQPLVRAYPDGRLLLISVSVQQQTASIVRLLPDGKLDPSFKLSISSQPTIRTAAIQPDGKILLGGTPNAYSKAPCLIRLNTDGSADAGFEAKMSNATTDYVQALAVQPDGRILVAGRFSKPGPGLVRLLPNGEADPSFQPNVKGIGEEVLCRPDDRILFGGRASLEVQGQTGALHQLLPNGQLDPTFDSRAAAAYNLVRAADSKRLHLLPGGRLCLLPLAPDPAVVFLLPSGQLDPARPVIRQLPYSSLTAATADSSGSMVLSGPYAHQGGLASNLVRIRPNGQLDTSFAPQLYNLGTVTHLVEQPGKGVVVAGTFDLINGVLAPNLARLLPGSGRVDTAFKRRMPRLDQLTDIVRHEPSNGLLLSGFRKVNGRPMGGLIRLNPDGGLDTLFRRWPSGYTSPTLASQPDGRILVTGTLGTSLASQGTARLLADGSTDPSFTLVGLPASNYPNADVQQLVVQPDGRILLVSISRVLRVLADGHYDPSFKPDIVNNYQFILIRDVTVQPNGCVTVCGQMPTYTQTLPHSIALRLLPNGRRDSTMADIFNGYGMLTRSLCYLPDGRLLIGMANDLNSEPTICLRQYLPDGTPDPTFTKLAGVGSVNKLLRLSDGRVLVGGYFMHGTIYNELYTSLLALTYSPVLAATTSSLGSSTEVYPNPARNQVQVHLAKGRQPQQLRLLDALGRLVLTQFLAGNVASEANIDVAGLPRGSYLLRIEYTEGSASTHHLLLE